MRHDALLQLKSAFLLISFCSTFSPNSGAILPVNNTAAPVGGAQSSITNPLETFPAANATTNLLERKDSDESIAKNSTEETREAGSKVVNVKLEDDVKSSTKRDTENGTLNLLKPFLFFPQLPFLFPKEEEDESNGLKDGLSPGKLDDEVKEKGKPFVFFKFAFNIREIPPLNVTDKLNESKVIDMQKLSFDGSPLDFIEKKNFETGQNSDEKKALNGFFDDFSLFPDSDLDDLFPKPDLFFPDFLFRLKPLRKLSRRKRAMMKPEQQNDFKFIMDVFDEAFTKTKRELEQTNPILDFLRGPLRKDFDLIPNNAFASQPLGKRRNKKNVKRNKNKEKKKRESSVMLIDKIVNVERSHENTPDVLESFKEKRETSGLKEEETPKVQGSDPNQEELPVHLLQKSRVTEFVKRQQREASLPHDKVELQSTSQGNSTVSNNTDEDGISKSEKAPSKVVNLIRKVVNSTDTILSYAGDLIKVMDTLEDKLKNRVKLNAEEDTTTANNRNEVNLLYDDIEKNITKVLRQFLTFFSKIDKLKIDLGEIKPVDWMEDINVQDKSESGKRSKKNADFIEGYVDKEKKQRQVADLNYLFLTMTLPTVISKYQRGKPCGCQ
ncbi:hypothetical protein RUM43_001424 [Polyplax serrata]|uniref:Uncharacterized protein n=1 Tax=Polyplax serrata TaxID=468196 RepID=A0AAN8SDU3_POLSC